MDVIDLKENRFETVPLDSLDKRDFHADPLLFMEPDMAAAARYRELGISGVPVPDIVNFNRLLRRTGFADDIALIMETLEKTYEYPVDVEYACSFTPSGEYRVNLLQCRTLQTHGVGHAGGMPQVKDFFFRIKGNFMGGNVCIPVRYVVFIRAAEYLDLPERLKYSVARRIGELNTLLTKEGAVLIGPGRWGTTTPSLGVPVSFAEISKYTCMCEVAYSSHGMRPELSYGSHFFQDLVESQVFYAALYRGEEGCLFHDALFDAMPDRYSEFADPGDGLEKVISVYDLGVKGGILYSEVGSQDCFLAKV